MQCTWCGRQIIGEPPYGGYEGEVVYFDGQSETVLAPEKELAFCSLSCCWRYGIQTHKAMGMSGKQARLHLIQEHGLTPPGRKGNHPDDH